MSLWRTLRFASLVAAASLLAWKGYHVWQMRQDPLAQGGVVLVYQIEAEHAFDPTLARAEVVRRTAQSVRSRMSKLIPLARVKLDGERLELQVPASEAGMLEPLRRILPRSARLEFKVVDDGSAFMEKLAALAKPPIQIGHDAWTERENGAPHSDLNLRASSEDTLKAVKVELPADHQLAFQESERGVWRTYYLFRKLELGNDDVDEVETNFDPQTGRPEVSLKFTDAAGKHFEELTARTVGRKLAILLDGRVLTAPVIESKIAGGRARITMGGFGDPFQLQQEAKDLVAVLRTGALEAPITLLSEAAR